MIFKKKSIDSNINKVIKLNFSNLLAKSEEVDEDGFKDNPNIQGVLFCLENCLSTNQPLPLSAVQSTVNCLKRVKQLFEDRNENSRKNKFRIVKSAKKTKDSEAREGEQNMAKSLAIELKADNYKQNEPQNHTFRRGTKLRRLEDSKKIDLCYSNEVKMLTHDEILLRLKAQVKKYMDLAEKQDEQILVLKRNLQELEEEKAKLSKQVEQKSEPLNIDLNFSLKCLQLDSDEFSTKCQKSECSNKAEEALPRKKQKKISITLEQKAAVEINRIGQCYRDEMVEEMKRIIVWQNQEMEEIRGKMARAGASMKSG